jgi:hypothetical protein
MEEAKTLPVVGPDKLVKMYLKMKTAKAEAAAEYEAKEVKLNNQINKVKGLLLDYCKEQGVESVRTSEGLFYRTMKTSYWTSDWESMGKFIIEHQVPELLEKRLHQGNMKQFLEEHPDLLPPGLNAEREYTISVRRK